MTGGGRVKKTRCILSTKRKIAVFFRGLVAGGSANLAPAKSLAFAGAKLKADLLFYFKKADFIVRMEIGIFVHELFIKRLE